jgi:hypothetical protein
MQIPAAERMCRRLEDNIEFTVDEITVAFCNQEMIRWSPETAASIADVRQAIRQIIEEAGLAPLQGTGWHQAIQDRLAMQA